MGPQARDPMMGQQFRPIQGMGQQFQPIGATPQGAPFQGMPPQAQGNAYGVPFNPLGAPGNPLTSQAPQSAVSRLAQSFSPFGRQARGGGGRDGR